MSEKNENQVQPSETATTTHSITSREHEEKEVSAEIDGALTSPLCRKDCKICNSKHLEEIHDMLDTGTIYSDVCIFLQEEHQFSLSPSSITRHITNFRKATRTTVNRKFLQKIESITDNLARDKAQASFLGNLVFTSILKRIETGSIEFDVSDWEKIKKLEHGILDGNSGSMDNLMVIFQKANSKYGVPLEQGSLDV